MKTPMQEMFDQLKASKKDEYGLAFAIDMLLENEEAMLKKEKEVIVNAVKQGWDYNEEGLVQWMGEKYYNETFNTEECYHKGKYTYNKETFECHKCGLIVPNEYRFNSKEK
jgi:uncharacterized GH25 family protein